MIIPDSFTMKPKTISGSSSNMKLKSNGHKIGDIIKTQINGIYQYELINSHKELIAIGRKFCTEHGNVLSVFDSYNNKIGSVERIVYLTPDRSQKFVIRNALGNLMGETPQIGNLTKSVDIFDSGKIKVGEMREKTGILKSGWNVDLYGKFDRRLLVFIPFFVESEAKMDQTQKEKK